MLNRLTMYFHFNNERQGYSNLEYPISASISKKCTSQMSRRAQEVAEQMIFENRLFPPVPLEGANFCVSYADSPETMVRIHLAILLKQWNTRGILL